MMKKISMLLPLLALVACENSLQVEKVASAAGLSASMLCSGNTVAGITGTANCSGGGGGSVSAAEGFYIFASRADAETLVFDDLVDDLWSGANPLATRSVATLKDAQDGSLLYTNNYSVIPRPLDESDGRYGTTSPAQTHPSVKRAILEKRHYLETIIAAKMEKDEEGSFISRQDALSPCGATGNIEARIAECRSVNGVWSFYSGAQYGQVGEGDWSQVSVVDDGGTKYEVWRDERTKLIWSDKASGDYNWYQASGYSKPQDISFEETQYRSDPGSGRNWDGTSTVMQPSNPISVCPDVVGGEIAAGGGYYNTYAPNPETAFKGNLSISNDVIWKLPSIDDYKLADVNGIRKVLPNMDYNFWSSSSSSSNRYDAWRFNGDYGYLDYVDRNYDSPVRCVAFLRD